MGRGSCGSVTGLHAPVHTQSAGGGERKREDATYVSTCHRRGPPRSAMTIVVTIEPKCSIQFPFINTLRTPCMGMLLAAHGRVCTCVNVVGSIVVLFRPCFGSDVTYLNAEELDYYTAVS